MSYKRVSGLPWQIVGESAVIIDPRQNKIHELDPVGTMIWTNLDGEKATQEIADLIGENYSSEEAMVVSYIDEFCETLAHQGLIESKDKHE
ncbi:MAG: PqqD family protein [Bdellovibrionaceae bacterium]|nr:PqqD family protein [Pseudobdellovibrionaceae bacterium]